MNWNAVVGANGRCKVIINKYIDKNGNEQTNNQVDTFYEPTAAPQPTYQQPAAQPYQQPAPPVQPQQPVTQQTPFPTGQPQQQPAQPQQGGFVPGQF